MPIDLCTYEDREEDYLAQKLLVKSLQSFSPSCRLHIPIEGLTQDQLQWLREQPNVVIVFNFAPRARGWDIKPDLLGHLLGRGIDRVTWIDSDIIVTGELAPLFSELDDATLVAAEEGYRADNVGTVCRARALGLPTGRELHWDVCSAVVSVTARHEELLKDWASLTRRSDYADAQRHINSPFYLTGDQELLSGLLGSAKFSDVPVRRLSSGRDIVHCQAPHFYPLGARLQTVVRGEPPLVHAQAAKPWRQGFSRGTNPLRRPIMLYERVAQRYASDLGKERGGDFLRAAPRNSFRPSLRRIDEGIWGSTRLILSRLKRLAGVRNTPPQPRPK
jgi:hypothetical protein